MRRPSTAHARVDPPGAGPASAAAMPIAAAACTARRVPGRTPRQSSRSETVAMAAHAASHTGVAMPAAGGLASATGMKPAQMAIPPTRGTGCSWSDRSVGRASGRRAASLPSATTATVASVSESAAATSAEGAGSATAVPGRVARVRPDTPRQGVRLRLRTRGKAAKIGPGRARRRGARGKTPISTADHDVSPPFSS